MPSPFVRKTLYVALALAANSVMVSNVFAEPQGQAKPAYQQLHKIDLPAANLAESLNALARQTGLTISADPSLLENVSSAALKGNLTVERALDNLLLGSGLHAKRSENGSYAIVRSETEVFNKVTVIGTDPSRYAVNESSSATGASVHVLDLPRSVQVVPEQVILDQQAKDLRDILRNVSGVQTRNISGGTTDAFLLRGVEVRNIFQDGFELDASTARIQAANIERVEVLKGPSALLYGQSSAGGVINVISKRPQEESRHFAVVSVDDEGQRELLLDSTGKANEDGSVLYRIVGSFEDSDIFRETHEDSDIFRETHEASTAEHQLLAPSLTWKLTEDDTLTFNAEFVHSELPFDNGTVLTQAADGSLSIADTDRSVRFGEHEDISDTSRYILNLAYEHKFENAWQLDAEVSYQSADTELRQTGANTGFIGLTPGLPVTTSLLLNPFGINSNAVPDGGVLIRSPFETHSDLERFKVAARFSGEENIADMRHTLSFGADINRRSFDSLTKRAYITSAEAGFGFLPGLPALPGIYLSDFNAFDINNPVYGTVDSTLLNASRIDNSDTQFGILASDIIEVSPEWKGFLGLRVDHFKREGENIRILDNIAPIPGLTGLETIAVREANTVLNRDQGSKTELSPNLGLVYQPNERFSLFANYSESFLPQFVTNNLTGELIDSDPIETNQVEVGLKGAFWDEKVTFNLAYYDITRENVPGVNDLFTGSVAFNEQEERRGIELDANVQFANGVSLIFNAAHVFEAEIVSGANAGNRPSNIADNVVNLWATYEFTGGDLQGLGLGGGFSHVGKRFITDANRFELDSYTTLDATAFYYFPLDQQRQLRVQLGVKNLTDETYYIPNNSTLGIGVGAPRSVFASVAMEF